MEMGAGLSCNGCGSTDVIFDPVKRLLICNQCGKCSEVCNTCVG